MHRPEYDMKIIGRNLKRLREGKNLSVDEVRKYLQLGSVQAIYKYENGTNYPDNPAWKIQICFPDIGNGVGLNHGANSKGCHNRKYGK